MKQIVEFHHMGFLHVRAESISNISLQVNSNVIQGVAFQGLSQTGLVREYMRQYLTRKEYVRHNGQNL